MKIIKAGNPEEAKPWWQKEKFTCPVCGGVVQLESFRDIHFFDDQREPDSWSQSYECPTPGCNTRVIIANKSLGRSVHDR